jgi:hypothetical protein
MLISVLTWCQKLGMRNVTNNHICKLIANKGVAFGLNTVVAVFAKNKKTAKNCINLLASECGVRIFCLIHLGSVKWKT